MFWQEAFVVGVLRGIVRDYVWAALQVERSSLFRGFWSEIAFRLRRPLVLTWPNVYITGGGDQIRLLVMGEARILRLLRDQRVRVAARAMNARLMRKGRCNAAASHCVDLADRIFGEF